MGTPSNDAPNISSEQQNQIDWEKRFKDTQSAYTKSQQELKATKAKAEILEKLTQPTIELDATAKQELEDLKYTDPDAWRAKVNALEIAARQKREEELNKVSAEAAYAVELERRQQVLEEFNRANGLNISDDTITYDVPPRLVKKLESNELTFEEFLVVVKDYLNTPKVVGSNAKVLGQPNLNKLGGDDVPTKDAQEKDLAANYKNITF